MLTGDTNYWYEASPVKDILFENNEFIGERANIKANPEYAGNEKAL